MGNQGRLPGGGGTGATGLGNESLVSEGAPGQGQERKGGVCGGAWQTSFRETLAICGCRADHLESGKLIMGDLEPDRLGLKLWLCQLPAVTPCLVT